MLFFISVVALILIGSMVCSAGDFFFAGRSMQNAASSGDGLNAMTSASAELLDKRYQDILSERTGVREEDNQPIHSDLDDRLDVPEPRDEKLRRRSCSRISA